MNALKRCVVRAYPQCWRTDFLKYDFIACAIVALAFVGWAEFLGGHARLIKWFAGNRAEFYGAVASISGSLTGFALAAISIVIAFLGSGRLGLIEREPVLVQQLIQVFFSAVKWLSATTLLALMGLLVANPEGMQRALLYLNAIVAAVGVCRTARSIWALELVVRAGATSKERTRPRTGSGRLQQ